MSGVLAKSAPKVVPDSGARVYRAYRTDLGQMLVGRIEAALDSRQLRFLTGKVNLIFTSPPFPLVHKKRYGNETGDTYIQWLQDLAPRLAKLLHPEGSIVVELGNAWVPGLPVMSTLSLEALLAFKKAGDLYLCQHVICHNPARLPSPAVWVNVKRVRLKDSFTHVWWMSRTPNPQANNTKVTLPYSKHMQQLLRKQAYNSGKRPSGHKISNTGFLKDHGGAISPNVVDLANPNAIPSSLLQFSGTAWEVQYRDYCKSHNLEPHPARMRLDLAAFFIQFLTNERDFVLDPFAGSNTTGAAAEALNRRWIGIEVKPEYAEGSKGRFENTRP